MHDHPTGNQDAVDVVADQFGNAGDKSTYARYFHRHGFHQDHRDSFGKARQHEDVGLTIVVANAILIDASFESYILDRVRSPAIARSRPSLIRSVTDQPKPNIRIGLDQTTDGGKKNVLALGRNQPSNAENLERMRRRSKWARREKLRVHSQRADFELAPFQQAATASSTGYARTVLCSMQTKPRPSSRRA